MNRRAARHKAKVNKWWYCFAITVNKIWSQWTPKGIGDNCQSSSKMQKSSEYLCYLPSVVASILTEERYRLSLKILYFVFVLQERITKMMRLMITITKTKIMLKNHNLHWFLNLPQKRNISKWPKTEFYVYHVESIN